MKKLIFLALGIGLVASAFAVPLSVREQVLRFSDHATTADTVRLHGTDVDTTTAVYLDWVAWPTDNSKPLGVLLVKQPYTIGADLDSVYAMFQWSHNDSAWLGSRYDATALVFDTSSASYAVSYSYIYADTSAGMIWPDASALRLLLYNASYTIGDESDQDSLATISATVILPRAD